MGVALLVVTVLAGALEVAKARRYPFNARGWLMAPRRLMRRTHWIGRVIDSMTGRLRRVAA
jgi:hypothetical protein